MSSDTLWVIHIGNNDRIALRAHNEGFVCVGWTAMGDLSPHDTREKMRAQMVKTWPEWTSKKVSSSYGQAYRFAHEMKEGDMIVFPVRPLGEIAIGRIDGPYEWSDDPDLTESDYNNVRPVKWLETVPRTAFSQAALHSFGSFLSVSTSDDYLEEIEAVLRGETATDEASPTEVSAADADEDAGPNLYETAEQETEDYLLKAWQRTGTFFEEVVASVFDAMGYTTTVTQGSGDHGIDVIAHPDPLGLERPYIKVQVKSGTTTVNEATVNQLRGLLNTGEQGVLISLGKYTSGALAVERSSANLTLIGPKRFVRLFLEHYDGLAPEWRSRYPLKQVFVPIR